MQYEWDGINIVRKAKEGAPNGNKKGERMQAMSEMESTWDGQTLWEKRGRRYLKIGGLKIQVIQLSKQSKQLQN